MARGFFFPDENGPTPKFEGSTLILPTFTIGNIGQLVIDLILTKEKQNNNKGKEGEGEGQKGRVGGLEMKRVGYLHHPCLLSVVGNDAYVGKEDGERRGEMVTNVEVYQDTTQQYTIIQQRAPPLPNHNHTYASLLSQWVLSSSFSSVLLLTSSDSSFFSRPVPAGFGGGFGEGGMGGGMSGGVIGGSGVVYCSNYGAEVDPRLGWKEVVGDEKGGDLPEIVVPRLSLAYHLWRESVGKGKGKEGFKMRILSKFCLETPDNVFEAMELVAQISYFLGWVKEGDKITGWDMPASWSSLTAAPADDIPEGLFF